MQTVVLGLILVFSSAHASRFTEDDFCRPVDYVREVPVEDVVGTWFLQYTFFKPYYPVDVRGVHIFIEPVDCSLIAIQSCYLDVEGYEEVLTVWVNVTEHGFELINNSSGK